MIYVGFRNPSETVLSVAFLEHWWFLWFHLLLFQSMIVSLICSTQPRWVPNTKALAWTCLCLMKQHFCIKFSWKISWPQMSTQGVAISTECALGMCSVFLINHNFQHNAKNHARKESVPKRSTRSSYTVWQDLFHGHLKCSSLQPAWQLAQGHWATASWLFNSNELLGSTHMLWHEKIGRHK